MAESKEDKIIRDALAINEDMDGFRILDFNEAGVYLSVHPPCGNGKPILIDYLMNELENLHIEKLDKALVKQVVQQQAGESIKIAPPQEEVKRDGSVRVEITKDKMKAWMTVYPSLGGRQMELTDCLNALKDAGVIYGILEDEINKALNYEQLSEPIVVAQGLEPIHGDDAIIEYKFDYNNSKLTPKELDTGGVDFYNLDLISNVRVGEVLALRTPPTDGSSGQNVLGEVVHPKPGKDKKLINGQNVEIVNNETIALAKENGQVVLKEKAIHVLPIYEHNGDVDFASGNLEFVGSIIVRGTVKNGFTVKAEGDVEIFETVEGGYVYSDGSIQVKKGIQGRGKGIVQAEGDVVTKYIENANVLSNENVYSEAIMHSNVVAGKNIEVGGKKGTIVGGNCCAGKTVNARFIGSALATNTTIDVGVTPQLRQEYNEIKKNIKESKDKLDKTNKALILLNRFEFKQKKMPEDKQIILMKVTKTQQQLEKIIENYREKKIAIEKIIGDLEQGKVNVAGKVYPGVTVTVGRTAFIVRDETNAATFVEEAGEVKIIPYSPGE